MVILEMQVNKMNSEIVTKLTAPCTKKLCVTEKTPVLSRKNKHLNQILQENNTKIIKY